MKIKSILVIADKHKSEQKALMHSARLAAKFGAKLHVVAFQYEHLSSISEEFDTEQVAVAKNKVLQSHQSWLSNKIADLGLVTPWSCDVVWEKNISAWIKTQSKNTNYDLIVKTGHRSEGAFYVPTDWHIMRNGIVPVLLVAEKKWRKKHAILVALDMGTKVKSKQALNQKLIEAAGALSTETGMPVHYCFCQPISSILNDIGLVNKDKALKLAKAKYQPQIQEVLGELKVPLEQIHIKAGNPNTVIPSIASKIKAELVVIGSVGRRGLKAKLMGNTAESILALLKTDVLVMQP
jgi:universal stress protein E